jgi:hypothetical protein
VRQTTNLEHPSQGAIIARQLGPAAPNGVPRFVAIPVRKHRVGTTYSTAAFLGSAYEAFEAGNRSADGRRLPPALVLPRDVSVRRTLDKRQALRETFNRLNASLDRDPTASRMDAHYRRAVSILGSSQMRKAFDLAQETPVLRDRYGSPGLLLARRLVESGATYVLVNGPVFGDWDTHTDNFPRLKRLLPPVDKAVSALLEDLDQRGLLDEILVVLISEMGRSRLGPNGGRDHWTAAYSVMLAGGGLTRGQVLGSTTSKGEWPGKRPVTVPEILATVYHQLGIDPNTMLHDEQKRPIPILPDAAKPIRELLA